MSGAGYVVVRWGLHGLAVRSINAPKWWAAFWYVNDPACEQVVPWQGTQDDTLKWVRDNDVKPQEWLP